MADYELQGEITTNTIDSEILSAPIVESELLFGDTVVIDHYYNGLESDTVKVTVDNDNDTIKADAVVDEKPTKNSNHLVTSGTIQNTNVMRNYVHLSSAASYNDVYTLLDNGNGCGIIPRISDTFIPFPDYLPPSPFAGQSVGDLTLFARITGRSSGTNLELEFTLLTLYGLEPAYKLNAYSHGTSGWTNTGWYKYDASVLDFAESEYNKSKNLFDENKYLSSYCTYASNKWTTNSTRIGYNQSILTNEVGATDNRNTSKLPLLKKGTYTLTLFNVVNNTNDTTINIAFYNQDGTINGTFTTATIATNTTITFTLASDLYLDIRVSGDTGTISFDHIQVEQGTKSTDYQPYYGAIVHQGDIITPTVLYDKDSSYPNLNWGYTSGIMTDGKGTLSIPVNFSPYKTIIFYARLNHMSAIGYYSVSTANNQFSILAADIYSARAGTNYFSGYIYNKIDLRPTFSGRGNTAKDNNTEYYIYRIEGIK